MKTSKFSKRLEAASSGIDFLVKPNAFKCILYVLKYLSHEEENKLKFKINGTLYPFGNFGV